jgi:hypothetical protein
MAATSALCAEKMFQYRRGQDSVSQCTGHGCLLYKMDELLKNKDDLLMKGALTVHVSLMAQSFPEVRLLHQFIN